MKKLTQTRNLSFSVCFLLVAMLLMSSCSSPQYFAFTPAPPAYIKKAPPKATAITEPATDATTLTASTAEEAIILPELAKVSAEHKAALASVATVKKQQVTAQPKQKLSLAQKVVLHKLQKQATKLERKVLETKDTAAGPASNRSAIGLILIGLVVALIGGLVSNILVTLGVLLVLIGLILLILNYI